jgi:hypothetical protein
MQSAARTAQPLSAEPAQSTPTAEAYTADHQFLVRLLSVPKPIPYEKYFSVAVGVYDANNPARRLSDVQLAVVAGMSHGLGQGFAHTMQSSPKIEDPIRILRRPPGGCHCPECCDVHLPLFHEGRSGAIHSG